MFNHLTYYLSAFFEKMLSGKSLFTKKNTMLIVRLDSIGDYVLFRNFLREIKNCQRYSGYRITILGNILWKDIAETHDSDCVDEFIWVSKEKFNSRSRWRDKFFMMMKLHMNGYEILMIPNDTRTKASEYIVKLCGAAKIISNPADSIFFQDELDSIPEDKKDAEQVMHLMFQFNRNKKFIEEVTGKTILLNKPSLNLQGHSDDDYIVVFPGAGHRSRRWSSANFAKVCTGLRKSSGIKIIICGDSSDKKIAEEIITMSAAENIEDMTGKTGLARLADMINCARLLLSNETCAVHLAASVNTPAVCISNGNHFGRFNPYPKYIAPFIRTIYPDELKDSEKNYFALVKKYHINSDLNINTIKPETVLIEAENLLMEHETIVQMRLNRTKTKRHEHSN